MKTTAIPILNRAGKIPDDGWYHVVPMGEFKVKHNGSTIMQVIDDRAVAAMAERYQAAGDKLLVDFDHFSYDEGHKSEAAGWVVAVEARSDGLWARIEWTDAGEPAIMNKRYRFVSPVWLPEDCDALGDNRLRPLRLDSIGLTNQPNLKGMQPLSNRGPGHQQQETRMKKVIELLGLPAETTDLAAVEAVTALMNRAKENDALKNRAEAAEAKIATMEKASLEAEADAFVEQHKDVIANRDEVRRQYIANRDATTAILKGLKPAAQADQARAPLFNRQQATPADDVPADTKKAVAIRNRAHAIQAERKCTWGEAFAAAQGESN